MQEAVTGRDGNCELAEDVFECGPEPMKRTRRVGRSTNGGLSPWYERADWVAQNDCVYARAGVRPADFAVSVWFGLFTWVGARGSGSNRNVSPEWVWVTPHAHCWCSHG